MRHSRNSVKQKRSLRGLRFCVRVLNSTGIALVVAVSMLHAQRADAQSSVRDSAGVMNVENGLRSNAPVVFAIGTKPLLDVGGLQTNPDDEFDEHQGYVRGVRLSSGAMVVIDVSRVHYFDVSGKRIRIVGTLGSGPKEFRYLTALCKTHGDTIVVLDSWNNRLAILDSAGKIVRTIPRGILGYLPSDGCFDDGSVALVSTVGALVDGARSVKITRLRVDGKLPSNIGVFPGKSSEFGDVAVVAAGKQLLFANPRTAQVSVMGQDGKLQKQIRFSEPRVWITDSDLMQWMYPPSNTLVNAAEKSDFLARTHAKPHESYWPAFQAVYVDDVKQVWVQDLFKADASASHWTAFDANGVIVGRLELPTPPKDQAQLRVVSFGHNDVLVVRRDEDGARHLTVYPIVKVEAGKRK